MPVTLVSITAHERVGILLEQLLNVTSLIPGCTIVVHISVSFKEWNSASSSEERWAIRNLRNVIVNPRRLATQYSHMYHAHVENVLAAEAQGIHYDYVMLLSSGDLLFRPGLAHHMERWPAGPTPYILPEQSGYHPLAMADAPYRAMRERVGVPELWTAPHEGSFYRRGLFLDIIALIREYVSDYDYDKSYPREEFFFPTLARGLAGPGVATTHSIFLGFDAENDRRWVASLLQHMAGPASLKKTEIGHWIAQQQAPRGEFEHRFVVCRVPRTESNVLRSALVAYNGHSNDRAARLLRSCSRADCLDFEFPARSNTYSDLGSSFSALIEAPREDKQVFRWVDTADQSEIHIRFCDLGAGYSQARSIADDRPVSLQAFEDGCYGTYVPQPGIAAVVKLSAFSGGLSGEIVGAPAADNEQESGRVYVCRRFDRESLLDGSATLLESSVEGDAEAGLDIVLELQSPGDLGWTKTSFDPRVFARTASKGTALFDIRPLREALSADPNAIALIAVSIATTPRTFRIFDTAIF